MIRDLNGVDRVMAAAHDALQSWGYAGFLNQTHLWLDGRVDSRALASAIARLAQRYPVLTSRLERTRTGARWRHDPGSVCPLREHTPDDAGDAGVQRYAEDLLGTRIDLEHENPISFHLLRRGDRGDVFLVQHSHAFMDLHGVLLVLDEINRLAVDPDPEPVPAGPEPDGVRAYLRQFTARRRLGAVVRNLPTRVAYAVRPAMTFADSRDTAARPAQPRLALRWLDGDDAAAMKANVMRAAAMPSLSLGMLASVLRAFVSLAPGASNKGMRVSVNLGVNIRSRRMTDVRFQNMASVIQLQVPAEQVGERDALIRWLNQEVRKRVTSGYELGMLQLLDLSVTPIQVQRRSAMRTLRSNHSFLYGYIHWLRKYPHDLLGAPLQRVSQAVSCWTPPGLTISVVQYNNCLALGATFTPDTVPEERVERFLDEVTEDAR